MDILFICSRADASSLLSNMVFATEARRAGIDAAVVLSGEALAATCTGVFAWPRELQGQEVRTKMADIGKEQGLPIMGSRQSRQLDAGSAFSIAEQANVPVFACPLWSSLLEAAEKLPSGVVQLGLAEFMEMLRGVKTVVGSL